MSRLAGTLKASNTMPVQFDWVNGYPALEQEIDIALKRWEQCNHIEKMAKEAGYLSHKIAYAMESVGLEISGMKEQIESIHEPVPNTDLTVNLEELDTIKKVAIAAGIGALLLLIRKIYKWITSGSSGDDNNSTDIAQKSDKPAEVARVIQTEIRNYEGWHKETIKKIKRFEKDVANSSKQRELASAFGNDSATVEAWLKNLMKSYTQAEITKKLQDLMDKDIRQKIADDESSGIAEAAAGDDEYLQLKYKFLYKEKFAVADLFAYDTKKFFTIYKQFCEESNIYLEKINQVVSFIEFPITDDMDNRIKQIMGSDTGSGDKTSIVEKNSQLNEILLAVKPEDLRAYNVKANTVSLWLEKGIFASHQLYLTKYQQFVKVMVNDKSIKILENLEKKLSKVSDDQKIDDRSNAIHKNLTDVVKIIAQMMKLRYKIAECASSGEGLVLAAVDNWVTILSNDLYKYLATHSDDDIVEDDIRIKAKGIVKKILKLYDINT